MRLGKAGWYLRWVTLVLPLLMVMGLQAEGEGWNDFLNNWRKADHTPATLLVPKDRLALGYWRSDEGLLFLGATGDMSIQAIDGPALAGLRESRGWKEGPHWILLGRDGSVLDEGTDLPKGEYLQSRLSGAGIPSTWELLNAFIREHPDHGTAIQRRLNIATSLARRRFQNLREKGKVVSPKINLDSLFPGIESARLVDEALPEDWCREVEETVKRLNQLPDPWRLDGMFWFRTWLDLYGKAVSPGLRVELAKLKEVVQEAWSRNPHYGRPSRQSSLAEWSPVDLGTFWVSCDEASRPSASRSELPILTPSPGRFWPDHGLIEVMWTRLGRGSGQDFLDFLDRITAQEGESVPWNESWSDWLQFKAYLQLLRVMTLGNLDHWQNAVTALQECRRLSGKHWTDLAPVLLESFSPRPPSNTPDKTNPPAKVSAPESFLAVLRLPPMEPLPPPPSPSPLRFLVWGQPSWAAQWESIRASSPLAPWGPSELVREDPKDPDTARLKQAGFPVSGWAVFQGNATILARGEGAPEAAPLAAQLRSVAPSRIHLLDDFVAKHPEHLDARRDRMALVKPRMPQAALEARLQQDAAAVLQSLDFGPEAAWITDLAGWRIQARKVVPELENALQRWPDNAGLWRAWISWNAFLLKPESVVDFAAGLPVFGSRRAWASMLPATVHRAVAAECRKERRIGTMVEWFEGAWISSQNSRRGIAPPPKVDEREKAIFEGYREALKASGRQVDGQELEREWAICLAKPKEQAPD